MKKSLFYLFLFFSILYSEEPSAFEAGDLNLENPYGLTKDEKFILKNKQEIKKIKKMLLSQQKIIQQQQNSLKLLKLKLLNYKLKIDSITQRITGIETILSQIDNLSIDVEKIKRDSNQSQTTILKLETDLKQLKIELNNLILVVNKNKVSNDNNTKMIINLIEELATNLDKLEKKVNTPSNYQLYQKALTLFKKQKYKESKPIFLKLYNKNYKIADVSFFLGEIEYRFAHYQRALSYYKKSIQTGLSKHLIDDLLYHTGYSLEKLGQKESAKNSYLKLINDYPNSMFVKYAKKRLNNLEKTQ